MLKPSKAPVVMEHTRVCGVPKKPGTHCHKKVPGVGLVKAELGAEMDEGWHVLATAEPATHTSPGTQGLTVKSPVPVGQV
jgi:hypothetical protein